MKLNCFNTGILDESDFRVIGFQGKGNDYFQIQDAYQYDEQDIKFGMNTYHIEINEQSLGMYGGIAKIEVSRNQLIIMLDDKGRRILNEELIIVYFEDDIKKEIALVINEFKVKHSL